MIAIRPEPEEIEERVMITRALAQPVLRVCIAAVLVGLSACTSSSPKIKGLPRNLPKISVNGSSRTPKHSMSGSEYPFDEKGNYKSDWVASGGPSAAEMSSRQEGFWRSSHGGDVTPAGHEPALEDTAPEPEPERAPVRVASAPLPKATPVERSEPKPTPKPTPKPKPKPASSSRSHTVKSGDTLYSLSIKYGTSVSKIQSSNGMSGTLIRVGQKLKIP